MGIERLLDIPAVLGFMLTLARISGVFVFVPLPGLRSAVDPARILLALGVAISLYPVWPRPAASMQAGLFTVWLAAEAALGLGIGLAVSFAVEAFMVGAQAIGLQAGFSFCFHNRSFLTGRFRHARGFRPDNCCCAFLLARTRPRGRARFCPQHGNRSARVFYPFTACG